MEFLQNVLSKLLRQTADDLDQGKYKCSSEEIESAIDSISSFNQERHLSKEQACNYLNMSRSTFDTYIRNGYIPKGTKQLGFKELSWNKYDLDIANNKITSSFIKNG